MVGDGPDRPNAEWLAAVRGVSDDVLFLGKSSEMERLLSVSDILLLPSELESFGLVALEAMASEVPVIATRVGGLSEVVEDGVDGYLLEVGDTESMAAAAASLLGDTELHQRMGQAGREHAQRDFCHEKVVQRYVETLRENRFQRLLTIPKTLIDRIPIITMPTGLHRMSRAKCARCPLIESKLLKGKANERSRTADLLITNQLLYQLSYVGKKMLTQRVSKSCKEKKDLPPVRGRKLQCIHNLIKGVGPCQQRILANDRRRWLYSGCAFSTAQGLSSLVVIG